jgi:hypothetical protein
MDVASILKKHRKNVSRAASQLHEVVRSWGEEGLSLWVGLHIPPLLVDAGIFCTNNMLFLLDIHTYEIYAVERKKKPEANHLP